MARDHERYTVDVAPYVLGALAPLEAEALETHLRACADCRRELVELRSGAELLSRSVEQIEPPAALRVRLLEEVAAEAGAAEAPSAPPPVHAPAAQTSPGAEHSGALRRLGTRLRRGGSRAGGTLLPRPALVLATGLLALVAGVAGWALGGARSPDDRTVAASVDRERLPKASARMTIPAEGEDPVLRLAGLRNLGPQRTYEIWVQRDGEVAPGPLFNPTADGAAVTGIPGSSEDIEAVFITRERAGGALTPTETPLVRVPLSS